MTSKEFEQNAATPRWVKDLFRFLNVKAQFILSGNIRDRCSFPLEGGGALPLELPSYLSEILKLRGYDRFIVFDSVDGFSPMVPRGEQAENTHKYFQETFSLEFDERGRLACSLERSLEVIEAIVGERNSLIGILIDYASRLTVRQGNLSESEHEYFARVLKLSQTALPHPTDRVKEALFNTIFWLCDRENDLPDWLSLDNPRVRQLIVPRPDHIVRRTLITSLSASLSGYEDCTSEQKEVCTDDFVDQTEGMMLSEVVAITQMCRSENLLFSEVGEAVRRYKLGVTEDPWKKIDRRKIEDGAEFVGRRVKGQIQAVTKSMDIIKRAVTGLSGSQASKKGGRPRGVLFLAGPTGVGKTELAKSLTELLFGDETAYIRFDMSEFSAEHADQRLLGAPPGYVGYDAGGELTNAIREKPFAVVLFDEIEKAHPRILDKFLQLLDDGVLTSGRGERVYFSEAVIIFTSNLGIYKTDPGGLRTPNVTSEDSYEAVAEKIRDEINRYFTSELNRPEILNRIGENIVVFDFIRTEVADLIFEKMLNSILERVLDEQKMTVEIPSRFLKELKARCVEDLSHGGRGIGNQLEAWFINPLARTLFEMEARDDSKVEVTEFGVRENIPYLALAACRTL